MPEIHEEFFQPERLEKLMAKLEDADPFETENLKTRIEKEEELEEDIQDRFKANLAPREYDENGRIVEDSTSPRYLFCADTLQPRTYYNKIMKGEAGMPEPRMLMGTGGQTPVRTDGASHRPYD